MIRLARIWYGFLADYHGGLALDHARRRDRALRKLEQLERDRRRRQTVREIGVILQRRGPPEPLPQPAPRPRAPLALVSNPHDTH